MIKLARDPVRVDLVGANGNAYALMARWKQAAREQGWPVEDIDRVLVEARSGDYDNLVATLDANSEPE